MENTFDNDLASLQFTVENDGNLSNGDKVYLRFDEEKKETKPINLGYKFKDDFKVEREIKDLVLFAEQAEDIKNLKDVKRMIEERANELFEDTIVNTYEYKEEVLLYRSFDDEIELNTGFSGEATINLETNGSLIDLYSVERYDIYNEKVDRKLISEVG